jgi:hypothetical protein
MASTLIESSTKKRFSSLFTVLEDYSPTEERVVVFNYFLILLEPRLVE